MAISEAEIAHALDLFADLGDLSTRKMFGGLAIYHRGTIFALVMSDGRMLIKGAGKMQARLDAMGLTRWTYARPGKSPTAMPYWALPDTALDDPDEATDLARAALEFL
jgi:DNA transformation protein